MLDNISRPNVPINVKSCSACGRQHNIESLTKGRQSHGAHTMTVWYFQCPDTNERVFVYNTDDAA